ncbi:hypothetical protein BC826DRAFT_1088648 [Russula brevipes]|nr:hypothetical protein BC826DRAFT_1088648 [Russula brevipes]
MACTSRYDAGTTPSSQSMFLHSPGHHSSPCSMTHRVSPMRRPQDPRSHPVLDMETMDVRES